MPCPPERPPLWSVAFTTYKGTPETVTVCTDHKRRLDSALYALGLPRATSARTTAGRCRNCQTAGARRAPVFDRRRRGSTS